MFLELNQSQQLTNQIPFNVMHVTDVYYYSDRVHGEVFWLMYVNTPRKLYSAR